MIIMIKKYCKCGCGTIIKKNKNFVRGHNRRIKLNEELIRKLYLKDKLSTDEIASKLKCGSTTIKRRLKKLNVKIRSLKEAALLAAKKGKNYMQSKEGKRRHGLLMKGHQHNLRLNYNRDYFKKFSRNMAYILGYIAADGCVSDKNLILCSKDKELLEQINKEMGREKEIRQKGKYYSVYFSSIIILNDLKKLGIKKRKTFTLKPLNIPKKFHSDFIRGFFDGDGCFAYHKTLHTYKSMITNASKEILVWIYNNLPTKKGVVYKRKNTNCYELRYGFEDTLLFGDFIYKNLNKNIILLKRKYNIFNKIRQHKNIKFAVEVVQKWKVLF